MPSSTMPTAVEGVMADKLDALIPQLAKLLRMLGSGVGGEITNTVDMMRQLLKDNGCDTHDLVARLEKSSLDESEMKTIFEAGYNKRIADEAEEKRHPNPSSAPRPRPPTALSSTMTLVTASALDATASREEAWDQAVQFQNDMFRAAADIGGINIKLIYFRGTTGIDGECKASSWTSDAMSLAASMTKIRCAAGPTQIRKVLQHVLHETNTRKVAAAIYVGDCCEEYRDQLVSPARGLGVLKVPVFMFQEGIDRDAQARFKEIADLTGGAYCRFDSNSAHVLKDLLRAVAVFAAGGTAALEKQGSSAARLLLGKLRGGSAT